MQYPDRQPTYIRSWLTLFVAVLCLGYTMPNSLAQSEIKPAEVLASMKRVADWQLANPGKHPPDHWTQGAYYTGVMALYQVSKDTKYLEAMRAMGRKNNWKPAARLYNADDQVVVQTYCELYLLDKDPQMIAPARQAFDAILAAPKTQSLERNKGKWTDRWAWCDALFMAPPAWLRLYAVTGDRRYLDFMDQEWWATTDYLYDPAAGLYSRDSSYFGKTAPNGQKTFWGRGNGWVYAGLARVLPYLPADHPHRGRYLKLYQEMTAALVKTQQTDGLWRTSLLDPNEVPFGESSASAFIAYGLAWGVNQGLLDRKTIWPHVLQAWSALGKKVQPDGMLGGVQAIGEAPAHVNDQSTEVYGTGAFLLAGSEIYKGLTGLKDPPVVFSAPSAAASVPSVPSVSSVPSGAATWCRFVPERKDDFAWENDLTAFRAYGPAIKLDKGKEDSGIDCWLKRVPYPIIDKWYAGEPKGISYHKDNGEGYDPYHVGGSRGCGGLAIWKDGKMLTAGPYKEWKIISREPQKSVFELTYDYDLAGETIREVKRITIETGRRLFQAESTFTKAGQPVALDIAIGITTHDGKGAATLHPQQGCLSVWETLDGQGLGTGVVILPTQVISMQEVKSAEPDASHALLLTRTDAAGKVTYQAGYGWQKAGEITTPEKWDQFLVDFVATLQ